MRMNETHIDVNNFKNKTVGIIGDPSSTFVREQSIYWKNAGLKVNIITYIWDNPNIFDSDIEIISTFYHEKRFFYFAMQIFRKVLEYFEKVVLFFGRKKYRIAMGSEKEGFVSFAYSIIVALSISRFLSKKNYDLLYGHDVFSYGLAVGLSKCKTKVIFPWGGDIYMYANTSLPAFLIVKKALNSVDFICPSSSSSAKIIAEKFKVDSNKIEPISWGVKTGKFTKSTREQRNDICKKYDINPNHKIILNVRRFLPAWGSEIALNAFIEIASKYDNTHFIFFGGSNVKHHVERAYQIVSGKKLNKKFTFFYNNISLSECSELMSISDIFTSLMIERDMRSFSILQAISSGAYPILSDQEEYRDMIKLGLCAKLVDISSTKNIVEAIEYCLLNEHEIEETSTRNLLYIKDVEDWNHQHNYMINKFFLSKS